MLQHEAFEQLVERVHTCRVCPRMLEGRTRVFGWANGNIQGSVLFIAEAPGRLGADYWGIPLFGDQTGRNFETLLDAAGLKRDAVFITNAVLCNPRDEDGHNATPTRCEVDNCSVHLRETIEIMQPRYVVTLGRVALQALKAVAMHEVRLAEDVGRPVRWNGCWLVALYHPSSRACIRRPLGIQVEDYRCLGEFVRFRRTDTQS